MIDKQIEFNDLDGNPVTETFSFNINKVELTKMEFSKKGGFSEFLKQIVAEGDPGVIMDTFRDLITKSVGKRSDDGRRFIKTDEIRDDFVQTDAYSELFFDLVTNAEKAAEFFKGVMPRDLVEQAEAEANREHSAEELLAMTDSEFAAVAGTDPSKMSREHLMVAMRRKNSQAA